MNSVQLIARLTKDPELRSTDFGKNVCRMRVAIAARSPKADPVFVDVVSFDGQAEACADHLAKGHRIGVEGRLAYSEWEAPDGSKRSRHEVVSQRIDFLGSPQSPQPIGLSDPPADQQGAGEGGHGRAKDAIPF